MVEFESRRRRCRRQTLYSIVELQNAHAKKAERVIALQHLA